MINDKHFNANQYQVDVNVLLNGVIVAKHVFIACATSAVVANQVKITLLKLAR